MPFATLTVVQAIQPIDLAELLAIFMGVSIVLVPVIGLTARFALKPTVEALSRFFDKKGSDEAVTILERRMALMEQQLESIDSNLQRLSEAADFDQSLSAPDEAPAQIPVQSPSPRSNE